MPSDRTYVASPPSAWADMQREFHLGYDESPSPFPRRSVHVAWSSQRASPGVGAFGLIVMAVRALRKAEVPIVGIEVEVTPVDEPTRTTVFPIGVRTGPEPLRPEGTTTGVLVGGFGTNAVFCLEADGQVLWPIGHPLERITRPKR